MMAQEPLWVFGYGSLMWNPGFDVVEQHIATVHGYHRSFCMRSIHHRGTDAAPGRVLALDAVPHASCEGVVFRVAPGKEVSTLAYLRERELISSAYLERRLMVEPKTVGPVQAVTFVVDSEHDQYCAGEPLEEQAQIIGSAIGGRGPNWEYLFNTVDHMRQLGLQDPDLDWLATRVRTMRGL